MWAAKIRLKHNCIIGGRCEKFKVKSLGYPLDFYTEKGKTCFLHFEKLEGDEKNIRKFVEDLHKDNKVKFLEENNNMVFFGYETKVKGKMPSNLHIKKLFFVKPVIVDETGYETWEVASWNRENVNNFINKTKKETYQLKEFKILQLKETSLNDVYFLNVMPELSKEQSRALKLAIEEGYYGYPREVELKDLAKKMKISLSTYREHLRIAERKVMPLMV